MIINVNRAWLLPMPVSADMQHSLVIASFRNLLQSSLRSAIREQWQSNVPQWECKTVVLPKNKVEDF